MGSGLWRIHASSPFYSSPWRTMDFLQGYQSPSMQLPNFTGMNMFGQQPYGINGTQPGQAGMPVAPQAPAAPGPPPAMPHMPATGFPPMGGWGMMPQMTPGFFGFGGGMPPMTNPARVAGIQAQPEQLGGAGPRQQQPSAGGAA